PGSTSASTAAGRSSASFPTRTSTPRPRLTRGADRALLPRSRRRRGARRDRLRLPLEEAGSPGSAGRPAGSPRPVPRARSRGRAGGGGGGDLGATSASAIGAGVAELEALVDQGEIGQEIVRGRMGDDGPVRVGARAQA